MSSIVTVSQKKPKSKRKLIIAIVAVVLALGLTAGALVYFMGRGKATEPATITDQSAAAATAKQVADTWQVANSESDYEKGKAALIEKVTASTGNTEKATIYLQLSQRATNNDQPGAALQYALEADKLDPKNTTARIAGDKAFASGDKKLAIKYYNLAIERTGDPAGDDGETFFVNDTKAYLKEAEQ